MEKFEITKRGESHLCLKAGTVGTKEEFESWNIILTQEMEDAGIVKRVEPYIGMEQAAIPLIKWLAENHHPHTKVIVDSTSAELMEGLSVVNTNKYLKD